MEGANASFEPGLNLATNKSWDLMISPGSILMGFCFCAIDLLVLVGNGLVIACICFKKKLQTTTNCFLVSLSSADLLVGLLVLPLRIQVDLLGSWWLGQAVCETWISLDVFLCTASILNLGCISLDRYFAIVRPLWYKARKTRCLACCMILAVWIASFVISCPPLLGWKRGDNNDGPVCQMNTLPGYVIYSALGSFYIPLIFILFFNLQIYIAICKSRCNQGAVSKLRKMSCSESDTAKVSSRNDAARYTLASDASTDSDHIYQQNTDLKVCKLDQSPLLGLGRGNHGQQRCTTASTSSVPVATVQNALCTYETKNTFNPWTKVLSRRHSYPALYNTGIQVSLMRPMKSESKTGTLPSSLHAPIRAVSSLNRARKTSKTCVTLLIIVGCFVVCWLPFFVAYILAPFFPRVTSSAALQLTLTWLGYVNSALNPLIYSLRSGNIRDSIRSLTFGNTQRRAQRTLPMMHSTQR